MKQHPTAAAGLTVQRLLQLLRAELGYRETSAGYHALQRRLRRHSPPALRQRIHPGSIGNALAGKLDDDDYYSPALMAAGLHLAQLHGIDLSPILIQP